MTGAGEGTSRLALVGLILSLTVSVAGMVVSAVALVRSSRGRRVEPAAIAGLIFGVLGTGVFIAAFSYVWGLLT